MEVQLGKLRVIVGGKEEGDKWWWENRLSETQGSVDRIATTKVQLGELQVTVGETNVSNAKNMLIEETI